MGSRKKFDERLVDARGTNVYHRKPADAALPAAAAAKFKSKADPRHKPLPVHKYGCRLS